MKTYLLLVKGNPDQAPVSPEDAQANVQKYMDYAARLRSEGRYVAADGLSYEIRLLKPGGQVERHDGPYAGPGETIGGFYVFTADSFEEATGIAQDCPALMHGGSIELREQMDYGQGD